MSDEAGPARRFPISFDPLGRAASLLVGIRRTGSYVEVAPTRIRVRMGWSFSCTIPRERLSGASVSTLRARITRGVHWWRGRWLVNGAGTGFVELAFDRPLRARLLGLPIRPRGIVVSVEDPDGLLAALGAPRTEPG